jgi:plastocyanin
MSARTVAAMTGAAASMATAILAGSISVIPASAASASVSIVSNGTSGCASGYCYQPSSATLNSGDSLNLTNNSFAPHTMTRCGTAPGQNDAGCVAIGAAGNDGTSADKFSSPTLSASGGTFSHTFTAAGGYTYYCTIHGYGVMHATVTVAAVAAGPSASPGSAAAAAASPPVMGRSGAGPGAAADAASPYPTIALLVVLGLGALMGSALLAAKRRRPTAKGSRLD